MHVGGDTSDIRNLMPKTPGCALSTVGCIAVLLPARAHAADLSFLAPRGPVAAAQQAHFYDVVLLMMVVIVPVLVLVPLFAWRYRYRNRSARYTPKWRFSWPLEVVIWGVPVVVVAVLAVWLWHGTERLDPYAPIRADARPLKVDVIGYDWKWLFVYPELHIATMGTLEFPANRPLDIELTSDTVMQSFFVPALGSQIYVMAGMTTRLHLKADTTGQFLGENTQYNGEGFQNQKFEARAATPEGFRKWVAEARAKGIALTPKVYDAIRARSGRDEVRKAVDARGMPPGTLFFSGVPADLFHNVVRSFHGGPQTSAALLSGESALAAAAVKPFPVDRRKERTE